MTLSFLVITCVLSLELQLALLILILYLTRIHELLSTSSRHNYFLIITLSVSKYDLRRVNSFSSFIFFNLCVVLQSYGTRSQFRVRIDTSDLVLPFHFLL